MPGSTRLCRSAAAGWPPGIRAREGHLQSATHCCVTYGPYVTQNRKEGPHMSTLRALAVTTATRSEALPDLPTVGDFVPGYEASAVNAGVPVWAMFCIGL